MVGDCAVCGRMIDVVCGVIRDLTGRYLACRRPLGKHLGGLWEFPGGKVDAGESAESALARELLEELAIHVAVGRALEPVIWSYDRGTIRLLPFECAIVAGELTAIEHDEWCWCLPCDFQQLTWSEADQPILAQLLAEENAGC